MQIVSNDAISTYETMREWTRFDRKTFCSILSSCRKLCADIKSTKLNATTAEIKFIPPKVVEIKVWNIFGDRYEYVPLADLLGAIAGLFAMIIIVPCVIIMGCISELLERR